MSRQRFLDSGHLNTKEAVKHCSIVLEKNVLKIHCYGTKRRNSVGIGIHSIQDHNHLVETLLTGRWRPATDAAYTRFSHGQFTKAQKLEHLKIPNQPMFAKVFSIN